MIEAEKEAILQLKAIYGKIIDARSAEIESSAWVDLPNAGKVNLSRTNDANIDTLSAHGTNGFALLLAVLTGKQLLPSNEREKRGIPTITGEAKYKTKKESSVSYHNELQNFVSTVYLQNSDPDTKILNGYSELSQGKFSYDYGTFQKKFDKVYEKALGAEKLDKSLDNEIMSRLYEKFSNVGVIIFGDGVGYGELVHVMGCENKYERVNIRAVVVPNGHMEFFQNLFSAIEIQDIALITRSEFGEFCRDREKSKRNIHRFVEDFENEFNNFKIEDIPKGSNLEKFVKAYGYDSTETFIKKIGNIELKDFINDWNNYVKLPYFSQDFVDTFRNKIPCNFYSNGEMFTVEKKIRYKNPDKTFTEEIVQLKYSIPLETEIVPKLVVNFVHSLNSGA
ncbi:hypothetical protein [Wolbachia endosymbiont of Cantharis cryptica]|uniref:hypothetical protein n=1 Tax=Wolbachia endosymbiont of Cantharis cryptica TaxID=3066132 RepID=UPI00376EB006